MKAWIYDWGMARYTTRLNRLFLESCREGAAIMDIGIGTGSSMVRNRDIIVRKRLTITGYDIDSAYIRACAKNIGKSGLTGRVTVARVDVFRDDLQPDQDHILFSDSFAVIPDAFNLIARLRRFLNDGGSIVVQTTLDRDGFWLPYKKFIKPKVKTLTSVDFGRVTTVREFEEETKKRNLKILRFERIYKTFIPLFGDCAAYRADLR